MRDLRGAASVTDDVDPKKDAKAGDGDGDGAVSSRLLALSDADAPISFVEEEGGCTGILGVMLMGASSTADAVCDDS